MLNFQYLHASKSRLSQFGVFGLQGHLQRQETALSGSTGIHITDEDHSQRQIDHVTSTPTMFITCLFP